MITTIYNAKQSANIADVIAKSYKEQGLTLNDNLYPTVKQEKWLEHASEQYDIPDFSNFGRIECSRLITAICAGKYPLKAVVETTYYAIIVNDNVVSIKAVKTDDAGVAMKYFTTKYENVVEMSANKEGTIASAKMVQASLEQPQQEERLTYDGLNLLDATVLAELADKLNVSIKGCKKRDMIIKRILMSQVA